MKKENVNKKMSNKNKRKKERKFKYYIVFNPLEMGLGSIRSLSFILLLGE